MTHWTLPLSKQNCSTVPGFPTIYFFGPPGSRCLWLGWDIFIGCIWQISREVPTLQNLGYHRRLPRFWRMNMSVPGCSGIVFDLFCVYHFNEFHPTKHHPHLPSIQWPWVGPPSCLVIWDPWTAKLKFVSTRCDEWNLPEIQQKPEFMVIDFTGCEWFRISWTALNVW